MLLTIVNNARLRLNQASVVSVIRSADTGVMQQMALLQDVGDELAERNFWQALDTPATFAGAALVLTPTGILTNGSTLVTGMSSVQGIVLGGAISGAGIPAGTTVVTASGTTLTLSQNATASGLTSLSIVGAQTLFPFPSGFGGLSPGLKFQSTLYPTMPLTGPVTDEVMAALKALPVVPLQPAWRVINGQFEFYPAPAAGEVYTFNFYSTNWIAVNGVATTTAAAWANDADTSLIDEKILTSGLEWRWLAAKGLDYAEAFRRYETRIARADGRQDKTREVSMSNRVGVSSASWPGELPVYDGSVNDGADFGFV
jgi:hypothetical protein